MSTGRDWVGENWGDSAVLELRDTFHMMVGTGHQLKTGLSYLRIKHDHTLELWDAGELDYLTDDRSLPFLYSFGVGSSTTDMRSHLVGLFAQDDWLVNESLTLSLGFRYDVDIGGNNPDFTHPLLPDPRGTDWNNLQPRLGFTWDLTHNGANVIRGGAGIFNGRYVAAPALFELGIHGETSRSIQNRINGEIAFGLPPEFALDPDDPENTGIPLPPSIFLGGSSLRTPQSAQFTLGYGRRLGASNLRLDIEGVFVDGLIEQMTIEGNWAGNENPGWIHPEYSSITSGVDKGHSRYVALILGLNGTVRGGHLIACSLTLADKKNLQDDHQSVSVPSDSANLEAEWGRSNTDERYRFVFSGVFRLPWNLTLAPFFEYGSGQPWDRVYGYDFNGDFGVSDRPPGVRRNGENGPPFRQLSLRLMKTLSFGGPRRIDLIIEAFNVLDTTNYDVSSVDGAMYFSGPTLWDPTIPFVPNPDFGSYRATHSPREIQLGLKYTF